MDAIHYDKIADKLMQFRSKLPSEHDLEFKDAINEVNQMKGMIELMLYTIDNLSRKDQNGWIR